MTHANTTMHRNPTGGDDTALVVDSVVKKFDTTTAVNGLSFEAPRASVLALLGPNGAGKTTTIEMCEGFATPTSGSIRVLGLDPTKNADEIRSRVGIMLQGGGSYPGIKVTEMLELVAGYFANPMDTDWLIDLVGLSRSRKTSYRRLSGGQQQRLSLACALVGRPELIFLDEPTAGMDTQSRLAVWELIGSLRRDGVTIVLTTHLMDEAEALADNVVIIDHGTKVAEGSTAQLTGRHEGACAKIHLDTDVSLDVAAASRFVSTAIGDTVTVTAARPLSYRLSAPPSPALIAALADAAAKQHVLIRSLTVDHRSLEDVFLDITGREMRA